MSVSNWYTLAAAVALLGLATLNQPWTTLITAGCGLIVGLALAADRRLDRSGIFGVVGFALAIGLAIFTLLRTMGGW